MARESWVYLHHKESRVEIQDLLDDRLLDLGDLAARRLGVIGIPNAPTQDEVPLRNSPKH